MGEENRKVFGRMLVDSVVALSLLMVVNLLVDKLTPAETVFLPNNDFLARVSWPFIGLYLSLLILTLVIARMIAGLSVRVWQKLNVRSSCRLVIRDDHGMKAHVVNQRLSQRHLWDGRISERVYPVHEAEDIEEILTTHSVDSLVLCLPLQTEKVHRVLETCQVWGLEVELILNNLSSRSRLSYVQHQSDSRLVIPGTPLTPVDIILKRATDLVLSALALLALSPIFLLIVIAIKLDDGGPAFFKQERLGIHRRPFFIYKFRSMCVDAESRQKELLHLNEMSYPVFKIRKDPRVTRVGNFLRRTSLDELPQLWNVLLGDMSLVGPRPPLANEVRAYRPSDLRRLSIKPGITCLWQISGRNQIDFNDWMRLDLKYIDNWSYLTDIKILFLTVSAVLKKHGAY